MRIGIDFRMLSGGRALVNRGMGRFTQQQLREVLRMGSAHEYVLLLLPDHDPALLLPEIAGAANVARVELPPTLAALRPGGRGDAPHDLLRQAAQLSGILADLGLDVYHATTPFLAADPAFWRCDSCALVATHYDLIPLVFIDRYFGPESQPERERYLRSARALRDADRLIAISEFVRREAVTRLGIELDRIDVAHPVADPCFRVLTADETSSRLTDLRQRCQLPDDFVLCVTHLHHAKNLHTFLRAFAVMPPAWRRRHQLVVVGDLDLGGRRALDGWTLEMGIFDDVVVPGFVAEQELVALYNAAYLFVHPSRYEGFGLPVLEAMQCGAPVIAGNAAALPEIVGEAGLLVDPDDPASFVAAIERLDGDDGLRRGLSTAALAQAARFSPRRLGEATLRGYERAFADAAAARTQPASRPRLAVWSPLPPQPSGVSDYTAELLGALRPWADAELFADDGVVPDPELLDAWPVFHYTAFERRQRWRPFDLAIYQMGASMFHLFMLDAVQRWPGLLVLHDMTFSYVRFALFAAGMPAEEVRRELLESAGLAALAEYDALTCLDPSVRSQATEVFLGRHLMLRPLIAASLAQIVHLPRAAQEIEALYPQARVRAFQMGVEDPWHSAPAASVSELRRRHGLPPDAFVVGVFGIADPVKRIDQAVRAIARLATRVPGARLIVVGRFLSQDYRLGLEQLACDLGVADRVRFFGQVAKGELNQLLLTCDAIVNLRHPFRKQMSATLLRAIAAGKPVAVTDVPDWDHFPASFCYRLQADNTEDEKLADWLEALALDPERATAISRAAREYYVRHGTLQQMAERYGAVIDELTGQPERPATSERPPTSVRPGATAAGPAPPVPSAPAGQSGLRHNKACEIEDFRDPELAGLIRDIFPHIAATSGASFPVGSEDRKHWEIAMSVRVLRHHGALRPGATLLGVGAGCELTSFYLTREVSRVVATDLYLEPGLWHKEASALMLTRPEAACPYPFEPSRLTVQHMDGRVLDYPADSFAGVFSSGAIEHFGELQDVAAAAYEIGRVLEPGGVATLSTELLIAGPPGAWGWTHVLLFDRERLRRYIVEASGLELVDDLELAVSASTLRTQRDLSTALRAIDQGQQPLPYLVLSHEGQLFGSVHLALRKTVRYPVTDNSWARPSERLRAEVAQAAIRAGERLREWVSPLPDPAPMPVQATTAALPPAGVQPAPPAAGGSALRLEQAFARWDAVRARGALTESVPGPLLSRALRFLHRASLRVRDLGVAWDRERELLRALIDGAASHEERLREVATSASRLDTALQRFDELQADHQALLAGLAGLTARQETLQARFSGLAVRQQALEQGLLGHARSLLTVQERLPGTGVPGSGWTLDASQMAVLLASLEREVPALARAVAVETTIRGHDHAEELRQAAAAHFGARLSSHGLTYRYPNDAWLHIDIAIGGERPILLETAASNLSRGGLFLLVIPPGPLALGSHPLLRPAGDRDLTPIMGAPAQLLIWEKL